jgi:hypothetical protein
MFCHPAPTVRLPWRRQLLAAIFALGFLAGEAATQAQSPAWTNSPLDNIRPTGDATNPALSRVALVSLEAKVTSESVMVRWVTANELRTVAYDIARLETNGCWRTVNPYPVFAVNPAIGGVYETEDADVPLRQIHCYRVIEYMEDGTLNLHGPYYTSVGWPGVPVRIAACRMEADGLRLDWPDPEGRYMLEYTTRLGSDTLWTQTPLAPGTHHAVVPSAGAAGFFRVFRVN